MFTSFVNERANARNYFLNLRSGFKFYIETMNGKYWKHNPIKYDIVTWIKIFCISKHLRRTAKKDQNVRKWNGKRLYSNIFQIFPRKKSQVTKVSTANKYLKYHKILNKTSGMQNLFLSH